MLKHITRTGGTKQLKHAASSIYPDDEVEKTYRSEAPLPPLPAAHFSIDDAVAHDVRRESFYPSTPSTAGVGVGREVEEVPSPPAPPSSLGWQMEKSPNWTNESTGTLLPVERRSSFYGFVSAHFLREIFGEW